MDAVKIQHSLFSLTALVLRLAILVCSGLSSSPTLYCKATRSLLHKSQALPYYCKYISWFPTHPTPIRVRCPPPSILRFKALLLRPRLHHSPFTSFFRAREKPCWILYFLAHHNSELAYLHLLGVLGVNLTRIRSRVTILSANALHTVGECKRRGRIRLLSERRARHHQSKSTHSQGMKD